MCSISVEVAEGAMTLAQDGCRLEDEDRRSGGVEDWVSVETVFWQERARACDRTKKGSGGVSRF